MITETIEKLITKVAERFGADPHKFAGPARCLLAELGVSVPAETGRIEPVAWDPLPEDATEKRYFSEGVALHGDVRVAIAHALSIFSEVHPGGSYSEQLKIMANEVSKLFTTPPLPTKEGMMLIPEKLYSHWKALCAGVDWNKGTAAGFHRHHIERMMKDFDAAPKP